MKEVEHHRHLAGSPAADIANGANAEPTVVEERPPAPKLPSISEPVTNDTKKRLAITPCTLYLYNSYSEQA
jgi:hypothetical protein